MRRLFIAGVMQETNGFSPIPSNLSSFRMQRWDPAETPLPPSEVDLLGYGAVLVGASAHGFAVVPSIFVCAAPAAPLKLADWHAIRDRIVDDLRGAGSIDAVFLFLHGAMGAQGLDDCEGDLIASLRAVVGPSIPIAAEYDLHGNVSEAMVAHADFTLACREYPHVDHSERSLQAVALLAQACAGTILPTTVALSVPIVGLFVTLDGPMAPLVERLKAAEAIPGVLAASAFHGFFAADIADMGASIVVHCDGDATLARRVAEDLAAAMVEIALPIVQRQDGVAEALDKAMAEPRGPIVIGDRADNAGGGAASDSTFLLRAVLDRGLRDVALALFWDPVAVDLCHMAGEGAQIALRIGGKVGPMSGEPVDALVEVIAVRHDARQAWFGVGEPRLALGRSAAVRIDGVVVVLCSERLQAFSRHVFTDHGIDPARMRMVIVKSTAHFVNDFGKIASSIIYCDAPGTVTTDFASLPFRNIRRPKWPLDPGPVGPPTLIFASGG